MAKKKPKKSKQKNIKIPERTIERYEHLDEIVIDRKKYIDILLEETD